MARTTNGNGLDSFIDVLVDEIASRLSTRVRDIARATSNRGRGAAKVAGGRGGARKLDMSCRFPGCRNRSKGPRFRFLCEEHLKLPKKEQNAVLEKAAGK